MQLFLITSGTIASILQSLISQLGFTDSAKLSIVIISSMQIYIIGMAETFKYKKRSRQFKLKKVLFPFIRPVRILWKEYLKYILYLQISLTALAYPIFHNYFITNFTSHQKEAGLAKWISKLRCFLVFLRHTQAFLLWWSASGTTHLTFSLTKSSL